MRIRFFNTYEPVSPFYRDLIPFLADEGISSEILISKVEYREGRPPLEALFTDPQISLVRLPAPIGSTRSRLRKLLILLSYIVGAMVRSLFGGSVDLNFFLTQPPLFAIWGYLLKRLRRQPYFCLVMDIYPDVAVLDGLIKPTALTTRLLAKLSMVALQQADGVIVIGRCMKERLVERGVAAHNIRVIPNWGNQSSKTNIAKEDNKLRKELQLDSRFTVLYSGNMGVSHFFDDILSVAIDLKDHEGIQFLFIGDGSRRSQVAQVVEKFGLSNVTLLPYQPLERLDESLSLGDIHFISLREGFEGIVVPSKAYGALAVSRPIIYQGSADGEIARMIIEEDIGKVVPIADPDALREAVLDCYANPRCIADEGLRAYGLHTGRYSRDRALNDYLETFQAHGAAQQRKLAAQPE